MPAYRNIRLCDKSCMCLFVCPTGATDTENSIIDVSKCIPGCMECVNACPQGAISMLPIKYPSPQSKSEDVINTQRALAKSKLLQEKIAEAVSHDKNVSDETRLFARAIAKSCRRMAEDIIREAGYLLPQSKNVRELLEAMQENNDAAFPKEALELLLKQLENVS